MPPTLPKHLTTYYNTLASFHQQSAHNEGATLAALEWIIDQYRVSTDPRSNIHTDPNNPDDPDQTTSSA